jgi:hypothetical protein
MQSQMWQALLAGREDIFTHWWLGWIHKIYDMVECFAWQLSCWGNGFWIVDFELCDERNALSSCCSYSCKQEVISSFLFMQRFAMNNVVYMEGFVIMVNVNSAVQIMLATHVRRVLQYCPVCQCVMMYLLEIQRDSIVHQVNSVYYSSLKL